MGRFIEFKDWQEMVEKGLDDDDFSFECAECEGAGFLNDSCHCCGQDTETDCHNCQGKGFLVYSKDGNRIHPKLTFRAYIDHVISDIKKACVFARWDFLHVAAEFFKEHGQRPSRYR